MKKNISDYLYSIGIRTEPFISKITYIHDLFQNICEEGIDDIFIDEYIKEDGTREYENLSFFTENYFCGANNFLTVDNYYIGNIREELIVLKINLKDYDFENATEKSRLIIDFKGKDGSLGRFKGSKENCDFLKEITKKYFLPLIKGYKG